MIIKLIASLNWVLGTIALLGALLASTIIDRTFVQHHREVVIQNVAVIVKAQRGVFAQKETYVSFGRNETARGFQQLNLKVPTDNFSYEAFRKPNGDFVIRGMTNESGVLDSKIPPFIYRHTISADGTGDVREFVDLSGKQRGLTMSDLFSF